MGLRWPSVECLRTGPWKRDGEPISLHIAAENLEAAAGLRTKTMAAWPGKGGTRATRQMRLV